MIRKTNSTLNLWFLDPHKLSILDTEPYDDHSLECATFCMMASYPHRMSSLTPSLSCIFRRPFHCLSDQWLLGGGCIALCLGIALPFLKSPCWWIKPSKILRQWVWFGRCGQERQTHIFNIRLFLKKTYIASPWWRRANVISCQQVACWSLLGPICQVEHSVEVGVRSALVSRKPCCWVHVYPPSLPPWLLCPWAHCVRREVVHDQLDESLCLSVP